MHPAVQIVLIICVTLVTIMLIATFNNKKGNK